MDTYFEKYSCMDETYLIFDPNKNGRTLDKALLHKISIQNSCQSVSRIVEGPLSSQPIYRLNVMDRTGKESKLNENVLTVFCKYLEDQKYGVSSSENGHREYTGITEHAQDAHKIGRVYLS